MENKEKGSFTEVNPKIQRKSKVICQIGIVQHERTGQEIWFGKSTTEDFLILFTLWVARDALDGPEGIAIAS